MLEGNHHAPLVEGARKAGGGRGVFLASGGRAQQRAEKSGGGGTLAQTQSGTRSRTLPGSARSSSGCTIVFGVYRTSRIRKYREIGTAAVAAATDRQRFLAEKVARENELAEIKIGDLTGPGTTVGGGGAASPPSKGDAPSSAAAAASSFGFSDIMGEIADVLLRGCKRMIHDTCAACERSDLAELVCQEILDEKMLGKVWKRKKRDPNAPKCAKTSYQLFCDSVRSQVREASGDDLSLGELSKKLGKMWSALDDAGNTCPTSPDPDEGYVVTPPHLFRTGYYCSCSGCVIA